MVEAEQGSLPVPLVRVVVRADLGDKPVADDEPLGPAVDAALVPVPRVGPEHRPFDHDLVALLDRVLEVPARVEMLHTLLGDLTDLARAAMRPQSRVVVPGVGLEVAGDLVDVARVEVAVIRLY